MNFHMVSVYSTVHGHSYLASDLSMCHRHMVSSGSMGHGY